MACANQRPTADAGAAAPAAAGSKLYGSASSRAAASGASAAAAASSSFKWAAESAGRRRSSRRSKRRCPGSSWWLPASARTNCPGTAEGAARPCAGSVATASRASNAVPAAACRSALLPPAALLPSAPSSPSSSASSPSTAAVVAMVASCCRAASEKASACTAGGTPALEASTRFCSSCSTCTVGAVGQQPRNRHVRRAQDACSSHDFALRPTCIPSHLQLVRRRVCSQVLQQPSHQRPQLHQLLQQQGISCRATARRAQQGRRQLAEQCPGGPLQRVSQSALLPVAAAVIGKALALLLPAAKAGRGRHSLIGQSSADGSWAAAAGRQDTEGGLLAPAQQTAIIAPGRLCQARQR